MEKSKYLISKKDFFERDVRVVRAPYLNITEFFCDTIQGEGISAGVPATFLRLQGCTLDCNWCDTDWRLGRRYSFSDLWSMMKEHDLFAKFEQGQRLILTGGSPLKQQRALLKFIKELHDGAWCPDIELENECVLFPDEEFSRWIYQWNNSPKLSNSGMKKAARYKPEIIKHMASLENSWFKFVIDAEEDIEEIIMDFLDPGLIHKSQVILMPLGGDLHQLRRNEKVVASLAIKHGVRFSSRMQLILNTP